ncbi:MAG TPA: hypothetical protein VFZ01_01880 [Geminicoccaceae bacterium]
MKVVVIGAGRAGTALTVPLLDGGHVVHLVGSHLDEGAIEALSSGGLHPALGVPGAAGLFCHSHLELRDLLRAGPDLVVVALAGAGLAWGAGQLRRSCPSGMPVLMLGGGLVVDRGEILPPAVWIARELQGTGITVGSLAGPWRPVDLLGRRDALGLLTLPPGIRARRLESALAGAALHVRLDPDEIGTPAALPLARLLAIGLGGAAARGEAGPEAQGQEQSEPSRGALAMVFAQAVLEIGRLIERLGGRVGTAAGPAALGHLATLMMGGVDVALGRRLGAAGGADPAAGDEADCGREVALAIGTTIVGWCATGRIDRDAIPLTRALIDALVHDQPLVLSWTRFIRSDGVPAGGRALPAGG